MQQQNRPAVGLADHQGVRIVGEGIGKAARQRGGHEIPDDEDATGIPIQDRGVGFVFQHYALFPHMTLAANVAFGLPRERRGEADAWLAKVGLAGMGARYPHELSGGQQQRAALARAMAPGPQVLLMDEPFASVDIVLRRALRRECRILLREAGSTVILVTHDPAEALDIGDRIAVMEAGRIVQFGTPLELHESPATAAVGAIFSGAQVVPGLVAEGGLDTAFGLWPFESLVAELPEGARQLDLLVQADRLVPVPDMCGGRVRDIHPMGPRNRVLLDGADGAAITVETVLSVDPERSYSVIPDPESVRAFLRG